ncbi:MULTISPECIES: (d)CMP kinase [Pseudobutyrivibrio]|jgi:cytidylate kinase|uniref:Cytidylate kinase n=2 Tax=Pseudobutyrivibrio TaxID=46205 RepID=A0A2G3EDZ5_9FIRM|nr:MULTISPECIES: (d)CMP kinase [Pseudobutyrivibrio]NEX01082.1 (d)CMP kinase [Pseudobutyrivibrio xylanivorans]PHU34974.1 (d)CMP kinase [Pseudobutyrivibrio ruminis]PHU41509.1 (d)CMP kinase [Pseudobutyrivibrio ruminis]SFR64880.1 cytidylate kinase [Pseudobutyrivibrio sp. NOR37]
MAMNVAIDGPAGAGKSTIAKAIAAKMGYVYVDTGAMYRAMALYFLRAGIASNDEEKISSVVDDISVSIKYEDGAQHVILNGEDVTGLIRTEEVGNMASASSVYAPVRSKLVALQQELAKTTDVIMDGRDIGTVVLPNADVKIFLTASVECRAKRRFDELVAKGMEADFDKIAKDIEERDYRDSHREISPLKQAEDAILVDSSDMTIDEVVNTIIGYCNK